MKYNNLDNLVSIVLPVYKPNFSWFELCIKSLAKQTYGKKELIVIIDPSKSNSKNEKKIVNITDEYSKYFTSSKVIVNSRRKGFVKSLNMAIALSEGTYIARADADDYYDARRLKYQVLFMKKYRLDICGTDAWLIDSQGNIIGETKMPFTSRDIKLSSIFNSPLLHPTVMFKKEILYKIGLYHEKFLYAEDYELWLRSLSKGFYVLNIPLKLAYIRVHSASLSRKRWLHQRLTLGKCRIYSLMRYFLKREQSYLLYALPLAIILFYSTLFIHPKIAYKIDPYKNLIYER